MSDDTPTNLSPFAARFARILFERYPEWKQYVVPPDPEWQETQDLAVAVPSRFPDEPLRIDTMDDEITISWRGWHTHCYSWKDGPTEEQFIGEALEIITALLSEGLVIVEGQDRGKTTASGHYQPDEVAESLDLYSDHDTVTATSWNGTYDQTRPGEKGR